MPLDRNLAMTARRAPPKFHSLRGRRGDAAGLMRRSALAAWHDSVARENVVASRKPSKKQTRHSMPVISPWRMT